MSDSGNPDSGPPAGADPGSDFDEWVAWLDREAAAGRDPVPPERAESAQGIRAGLGDVAGIDPGLLAAVCGLDGPGDERTGSPEGFAQDAPADMLPPGPALAALTEAAVEDVARLSDDQLIGVLRAAQRQANREAWKKALVIAEFARRREAEFRAAAAGGVPVHCRPGQFPGEELAMELLLGPVQASHAIDDATGLTTRLPATLAAMAAGLVDEARAGVIAMYTRSLSAADAALADEILAAAAPDLRLDQLIGKAARLEMRLAPEAVAARKQHARRARQRVEVRREESGNATLAGREMDTGDALAARAHIHALALRLRRAGAPGTLDRLRLLVFADLTAGRDPLGRLPGPGGQDAGGPNDAVSASERGAGPTGGRESLDYDDDYGDYGDVGRADEADAPAPSPRPPAPVPALINLVVPAGTLFGWDSTPSEAGGWGLLDSSETGALVAAASRHPATRWCVTVTGPDGTAAAHGCASGRRLWPPGIRQGSGPPDPADTADNTGAAGTHPPWPPGSPAQPGTRAGPASTPTARQAAHLAEFLRGLNVTLQAVARGSCDHAATEPRYTPSRKLAHLVRARSGTCDAPGCAAQAVHADLDHTIPYPDGPTDQCNLGPRCRRHHKAKQAPDWKVEQPEPGVTRWTLPSGRTHTTRPTAYGSC